MEKVVKRIEDSTHGGFDFFGILIPNVDRNYE